MSDANKDTPQKERRTQARAAAVEAAQRIGVQCSDLDRDDRVHVAKAFRGQLIPPRCRGRKRSEQITAAHADWKGGLRGVRLYQKHIPGFDQLSEWRRRYESRRLLEAIRSRERRVAKPVDDGQQGDSEGQ